MSMPILLLVLVVAAPVVALFKGPWWLIAIDLAAVFFVGISVGIGWFPGSQLASLGVALTSLILAVLAHWLISSRLKK